MTDLATLILDRDGPRAWVRLNRAEKRNALSPEVIRDLSETLSELEEDPDVRVLIITGEGSAFSSGMDLEILQEISQRSYDENLSDSKRLAELFLRIHRYPKPIIAAVNGPAVAGGCGLATVCDFTIASTDAKFCYSEVKIGFVAAIVACFLLRIVGEKIARDLLLTARMIDANEALRLGLITEVVPADQLRARAAQLADQLAENSPTSLAATKELLSRIPSEDIEDDLKRACKVNARTRGTPDCREGIAAFLEKRPPQWGRNGDEEEDEKEKD